MTNEQLQGDYETISTKLLDWIEQKNRQLSERNFPNSLQGIKQKVVEFNQYRTEEKPPK